MTIPGVVALTGVLVATFVFPRQRQAIAWPSEPTEGRMSPFLEGRQSRSAGQRTVMEI